MALYVTDQELRDGLDTKVDKSSIDTSVITNEDTRVVSSKLMKQKLAEVTLPANLKKCIEEFDNMYMGYKAAHPTADINGATLSTGLMYWNTTDEILYIYQDGSGWIPSISTAPTVMPQPISCHTYDTKVTTTTKDVIIPSGYNPDNVVVYLNGIRMSTEDYTADDGTKIHFEEDVNDGDVVSITYATEDVLNIFDVHINSTTTTVAVPNGYDPATLSVYVNGVRMSVDDYSATNGTTIEFETPVENGDVVSGQSLKDSGMMIPIVQEYPAKEDFPEPAKNGSLAFDLTEGQLYYYSTAMNGWVGWNSGGEDGKIGFYDKFEDFPHSTVAIEDELYIARNTKNMWLFDGSNYIPIGVWSGNLLPATEFGREGTLYLESESGILYRFDGSQYVEVANPNKEPIQTKDTKDDFIYTGVQDLFLAKNSSQLYWYDGADFIPISNSGVGEVKFIDTEDDFKEVEEVLQIAKDTSKAYFFEDGKKRRLNKEIYRIATNGDLDNAVKDEDFIYIVDDTNTLYKWDNGTDRFETLGTPKVVHFFAKESDITKDDDTPTRTEVEQYASDNGLSDGIIWGNNTDSTSPATTWAYSVDDNGKCVLLYSKNEVHINGFLVIDGEQSFDGTLIVRVEDGIVELKDGSGATINIKDTSSSGNLSDGTGVAMGFYNGQKFPKIDTSINNNEITVNTGRLLNSNILYDDDFIEIIK